MPLVQKFLVLRTLQGFYKYISLSLSLSISILFSLSLSPLFFFSYSLSSIFSPSLSLFLYFSNSMFENYLNEFSSRNSDFIVANGPIVDEDFDRGPHRDDVRQRIQFGLLKGSGLFKV